MKNMKALASDAVNIFRMVKKNIADLYSKVMDIAAISGHRRGRTTRNY